VSVQADQVGEEPPQRGPGVHTSRPVTAHPSDSIEVAAGDALRSIGDFLQQDMARVDNFEASIRAGIEGSLRDVDDLLSEVLDAEAPHKVARCVLSAQISLRHALAAMPRMS
jgi:hypothetical protein